MSKIVKFYLWSVPVLVLIIVMAKFGILASFGLLMCAVGAVSVTRPVWLAYITFGFLSVSGALTALFPSVVTNYADEGLFLLIIGALLLLFLLQQLRTTNSKTLHLMFLLLFGITLFSWLVNRPSLIQLIHFMVTYLSFIPLYFLGAHVAVLVKASGPIRLLVALLPIHLFLNVLWLLGINPLPNPNWLLYDVSIGLFYDAQILGYCTMFMILILFSCWLRTNNKKHKPFYLGALFLTMLQYLLTFTVHSIPLLILLLALGFILFWKEYSGRILKYVLMFSPMVIISLYSYEVYNQNLFMHLRQELAPKRIVDRVGRVSQSPKGIVYRDVFISAPRNPMQRAVGFGPGNFASIVGIQYESYYTERYIAYLYQTYVGRELWQSGSFIENPQTSVTGLFSEIGYLGGMLYYAVHIYIIITLMKRIRAGCFVDPTDRAVAEGWVLAMIGYLMLSPFWDMFQISYFRSGLWFWGGILLYKSEQTK